MNPELSGYWEDGVRPLIQSALAALPFESNPGNGVCLQLFRTL
jgi:hypothetical protein